MQQKVHAIETGLEELNGLYYEKYAIKKGNALNYGQALPLNQKSYELTSATGDIKEALLAFQQDWKPVLGGDDHY
ncbi:hypothetical protein E2R55_00965 [Vibrio vulnificus]|nr:hypothetical protein E2R55_00965 [Vibrio vulnificus]